MLLTGRDDKLWKKIASRIWPERTLRLSPYYQTYQVLRRVHKTNQESSCHGRVVQLCLHMLQGLVQGNNVRSAWPVMDLAGMRKCSTWKYNLPHRFYQCRLFALQYNPLYDHIRHVTLSRIHSTPAVLLSLSCTWLTVCMS